MATASCSISAEGRVRSMSKASIETDFRDYGLSYPLCKVKQTNADRIRSMSDEELAEMFYGSTTEDDQLCLLGKRLWLEDIYDWLQSEVEVDKLD